MVDGRRCWLGTKTLRMRNYVAINNAAVGGPSRERSRVELGEAVSAARGQAGVLAEPGADEEGRVSGEGDREPESSRSQEKGEKPRPHCGTLYPSQADEQRGRGRGTALTRLRAPAPLTPTPTQSAPTPSLPLSTRSSRSSRSSALKAKKV